MRQFAILVVSLAAIGGVSGAAVAASGPMADAGLDQTVSVETMVQLDGTGSTHPSGSITDYEWRVRTPDDREFEPECTDCERARFTPLLAGRYEVTLTVTGADGATATDTLYVDVRDAGPAVDLQGDRTPTPGESTAYRATAESTDAELSEIAWLVEDEIVAVQSLSGSSDDSEISLAFAETETHRVRVIVGDTNGRTAQDRTFVRPRAQVPNDDPGWSDTDPDPDLDPDREFEDSSADCDDPEYRASNAEECRDGGSSDPTTTPTDEDGASTGEQKRITYVTDGYRSGTALGPGSKTSDYANLRVEEVGLDGGENAPWKRSNTEAIYDMTVGSVSRVLFGQERKTVTCEMTGGERRRTDGGCAEKITELESRGETTNAYSSGEAGGHSEYGLVNGRRVAGDDPTELGEGETAEVTVVIQREKDGIVDKTVRAADRARSAASDVLGVGDGGGAADSESARDRGGGSVGDRSESSVPGGNGGGPVAGTGPDPWGSPQSAGPADATASNADPPSTGTGGVGKGLVP